LIVEIATEVWDGSNLSSKRQGNLVSGSWFRAFVAELVSGFA